MTAQVSNTLIMQGAAHPLLTDPLQGFFAPERPQPPFCAVETANWDGYLTTWEIRDDSLYLVRLEGTVCLRKAELGAEKSSWCEVGHSGECEIAEISLRDICDVPAGGFCAHWFSGTLRVPQGALIHYVHAGWASKYERELLLVVQKGQLTSQETIFNQPPPSKKSESRLRRMIDALRPGY